MRWLVIAGLLAGCSHSEGRPHAGEDVPRSEQVRQNAIPRDLPPATPPIPPTSRSGEVPRPDAGSRSVTVNPQPDQQVPNPPPPQPVP